MIHFMTQIYRDGTPITMNEFFSELEEAGWDKTEIEHISTHLTMDSDFWDESVSDLFNCLIGINPIQYSIRQGKHGIEGPCKWNDLLSRSFIYTKDEIDEA